MTTTNEKFITLVTAAKKQIKEIDVPTLKLKLKNSSPVQLIDVREAHEWLESHIPKATHLSKGMLECSIEKIDCHSDDEIILYCGSGARSALAAESLQKMGYTNVWSLQGGFKAWQSAE